MKTLVITEQDCVLAFKLNALKNPCYGIAKWRWVLPGIGISALFIGIYLHQYSAYKFASNVISLIGLVILGLGFILWFLLFLTTFGAKRTWRRNKILQEPYTLTWNDTHLFIEHRQSKSQSEWSTYCKIIQDDNYILAFCQQHLFHIISKRFFENKQEMQDFLSKLEAGVAINKANNA